MEPTSRLSMSSSAASYIDDSLSTTDESHAPSRPSDASYQPYHRTSTPASWYATLASEPPRAEDFIIYDDSNYTAQQDCRSLSQRSQVSVLPSDGLPSDDQLAVAENLVVYDAQKAGRPFKNLYTGPDRQGFRQLIVFIRHFYCGACQDYVKALGRALPKSTSPGIRDTKVIVITCCSPSLLSKYTAVLGTGFEIYTDPKRKLFKALGCKPNTMILGRKKAKYLSAGKAAIVMGTFLDMGKAGINGFKGGYLFQIGGEFLFELGRPVWCHRMTDMSDHTEVDVIEQVLRTGEDEIQSDSDDGEDAFNEEEGSFACSSSLGTCGSSYDLAALRRVVEEIERRGEANSQFDEEAHDDEGSSTHRPTTLRRVTEEYSEDDRTNLRERPSCVPRFRSDELEA